jgi:phytoene/squalene synthetase
MSWEEGSDLVACAQIVEKADAERFASVMAAPVAARAVLFPIYAFNAEVTKIPWVTQEPMIAEMRFQWWRDVLDEIEAGGLVRRHQVVTPLALVLDAESTGLLRQVIEARRNDLEKAPFKDAEALKTYLRATAGGVMQAAAYALGARDLRAAAHLGYAHGMASYLRAVPELVARGKLPLPDGRDSAVQALAHDGLQALGEARRLRSKIETAAGPALGAGMMAAPILRKAASMPAAVGQGALTPSEAQVRLRRLWVGLTGRW